MIITDMNKLLATVIEVSDLGEQYPASIFNGRIGLDIHIDRGAISTGKKVLLHGPNSEEEVEIVGIEMLSRPTDLEMIRLICSKPKVLALPKGKAEGWTIVEI